MPKQPFIDCHCHLFNIEDAPLYATLRSTLDKTSSILLLAGVLTGVHRKIPNARDFIIYFDGAIHENIEWLVGQIRDTLSGEPIILTPLTMDFSQIAKNPDFKKPGKRPLPAKDTAKQMGHLRRGIAEAKDILSKRKCSILPFFGYDLRKISENPSGLKNFITFWERLGGVTSKAKRKNLATLKNGSVIGVKLYPPIGFKPCLEKGTTEYRRCLKFYQWCVKNDIPITAHCQKGSYSLKGKAKINANTHPNNWSLLLQQEPSLADLRINFAHFGGEKDIEKTIDPETGRLKGRTWCRKIMEILKTHKNAYADVSAFDFSNEEACESLLALIARDLANETSIGEFSLVEKLLWGSDVPMVVNNEVYRKGGDSKGDCAYKHLYAAFERTIRSRGLLTKKQQDAVIKAMTSENPLKFLKPE
jgi:Amidohydrolase